MVLLLATIALLLGNRLSHRMVRRAPVVPRRPGVGTPNPVVGHVVGRRPLRRVPGRREVAAVMDMALSTTSQLLAAGRASSTRSSLLSMALTSALSSALSCFSSVLTSLISALTSWISALTSSIRLFCLSSLA